MHKDLRKEGHAVGGGCGAARPVGSGVKMDWVIKIQTRASPTGPRRQGQGWKKVNTCRLAGMRTDVGNRDERLVQGYRLLPAAVAVPPLPPVRGTRPCVAGTACEHDDEGPGVVTAPWLVAYSILVGS